MISVILLAAAMGQHQGDPRLDVIARQWEARLSSAEARIAALEAKFAPAPKSVTTAPAVTIPATASQTMVCGPDGCTIVPTASYGYQQPMFYSAPMFSFGEGGGCVGGNCGSQSFGRRGLFGRRR